MFLPYYQRPSFTPIQNHRQNFLHPPVTSSLFGPNTLSLCSSLNIRDQVSHPYRTTGKIFSILLSLHRFLILISSSTPCSQTRTAYVAPLVSETRFRTHTKSRAKLIFSF
jgi:hypothetical protein